MWRDLIESKFSASKFRNNRGPRDQRLSSAVQVVGSPDWRLMVWPAIPGGVFFAGICWDFDLLFRKRSGHDACLDFPVYFSGKRICPVWIALPRRYDRSFVRMHCSS